jgi:hypothetical protein
MSSSKYKYNMDNNIGPSPIGKCSPPGTYINEDGKLCYKTCPDNYDGPMDRIHYDYRHIKFKEVEKNPLPPRLHDPETPEGILESRQRERYLNENGIRIKQTPEQKQIIKDMVVRLRKETDEMFNRKPAPTPPQAQLVTIADIFKRLEDSVKEPIPDTVQIAGKRKLDFLSSDYINPLPLKSDRGIKPDSLLKAKQLYTKIIIDKDIWPKWTHRWFNHQASILATSLSQGTLNKHQFNTIHKTYYKLGHPYLTNSTIVTKSAPSKVIKSQMVLKNKPLKSILLATSNGRERRHTRNRKMCLTNGNNTSLAIKTLLSSNTSEYMLPLGAPFKMNNKRIMKAINARRESWKRRKRKL